MTINQASRVIVGVDESLAGLRALRFAVAEARRRSMLLAVRSWSAPIAWPPGPVVPVTVEETAQQAEAEIHRAFTTAMVEAHWI